MDTTGPGTAGGSASTVHAPVSSSRMPVWAILVALVLLLLVMLYGIQDALGRLHFAVDRLTSSTLSMYVGNGLILLGARSVSVIRWILTPVLALAIGFWLFGNG